MHQASVGSVCACC